MKLYIYSFVFFFFLCIAILGLQFLHIHIPYQADINVTKIFSVPCSLSADRCPVGRSAVKFDPCQS